MCNRITWYETIFSPYLTRVFLIRIIIYSNIFLNRISLFSSLMILKLLINTWFASIRQLKPVFPYSSAWLCWYSCFTSIIFNYKTFRSCPTPPSPPCGSLSTRSAYWYSWPRHLFACWRSCSWYWQPFEAARSSPWPGGAALVCYRLVLRCQKGGHWFPFLLLDPCYLMLPLCLHWEFVFVDILTDWEID